MTMHCRALAAATAGILTLLAGLAAPAQPPPQGVNAGSLTCTVAGDAGFVFGATRELACVFTRSNGTEDRYTGTVQKYGVDVGFATPPSIVWLVFAPAQVANGALAGDYSSAEVVVGANRLLGGRDNQVSLQPVSIQGDVGFNVAAGVAEITLRAAGRNIGP